MKIVDGIKIYVAYLIGSIHYAKDRARAFDASERAVREAGHEPLNPVKEEPIKTGMSCDDSEKHLAFLWKEGKKEEYDAVMEAIWTKDLENVRKADYLVLHFEQTDQSIGAPLEMTVGSLPRLIKLMQASCEEEGKVWLKVAKFALEKAGYTTKPIYWVCQGPISEINSTLKWLANYKIEPKVFKTYKELTEFLKETYK